MSKQMMDTGAEEKRVKRSLRIQVGCRNIIKKIREIERDLFGEAVVRHRGAQQRAKKMAKEIRGNLRGKTEITQCLIHL